MNDNWIPVSERLPDHYGDVKVFTRGGKQSIGWIDKGEPRKWSLHFIPEYNVAATLDELVSRTDVTHWQPLDEPPALPEKQG